MLSHLQNTSDERINPATEDKQDDILAAVQAVSGGAVTIKKATRNDIADGGTLVAAVDGKSIYVIGGLLTVGVADGTVTIKSDTTAISVAYNCLVGGQINILPRPTTRPIWQTAAGEALKVSLSGVGQTVSGDIEYIEV